MRCLTTNIWTPEQGVRDSIGAWLLSFIRLSSTSIRHRVYCFLILGLPTLLLILSGMSSLFTEITWLYWLVLTLCLSSFFFVFIPLTIYSVTKARQTLSERLFHSDFIFISFLSIFLTRKLFHDEASPSFLIFFESLTLAWLLLRLWEAYRWQSLLINHFERSEYYWDDPFKIARAWRWAILFIGAVILLNFSLLNSFGFIHSSYKAEKFMLAFLILSLPLTQWITNRFLAEADHYNFRSNKWQNFLDLRKLKSLIFHQHGVLTDTVQKIEEIWIDESEDFEQGEIEEALSLLCAAGKHPVCGLVSEKMKKSHKLLRLIEAEERPHLGMLAELEGLDRQSISACLGTLSWQKILKHEISEAGMQTLRSWRSQRYSFSLLSLNRSVVGAIAWKTNIKTNISNEIRALRSQGFQASLISSQIYPSADLEITALKDSSFDLLPIERPVHIENWLEREPKALIVRSFWDAIDNERIPLITVTETPAAVKNYDLAFSTFNIRSLSWVLKASKNYFKGLVVITTTTLVTAIAVAGISSLYISVGLFFAFSAACTIFLSRSLDISEDPRP